MSAESGQPKSLIAKAPGDLRAGERVLQYLLAEFESPDLRDGCRLPSNKELAERLNVSTRTVHAVLAQLAREGRVRTRRGSGTYLVSARPKGPTPYRIMVASPLISLEHADNSWDAQIGAGLFQAAVHSGVPLSLEGFPIEMTRSPNTIIDMLVKRCSDYSGMVLLPYSLHPEHSFIVDLYEKSGKPVVQLYPSEVHATANFVAPDFYASFNRVTEALAECGRRRFAYITLRGIHRRYTNLPNVGVHLRLMGITTSLAIRGLPPPAILSPVNASEEEGYRAMKEYLRHAPEPPDAVLGIADQHTVGAARALQEAGLDIPGQVSIVSGTGVDVTGTPFPHLTRIRVGLHQLGSALIEMLIARIRHGGRPVPGRIYSSSMIYGDTTRPEENRLLQAIPGV